MPDSITITLAIPHERLHPNHKPINRQAALYRGRLVKEHRRRARDAMTFEIIHLYGGPTNGSNYVWPGASMVAEFFTSSGRAHDDDNAIGWLKSYRDGFADAGLVPNDKAIKSVPPRFFKTTIPRVEITLTRADAPAGGAR